MYFTKDVALPTPRVVQVVDAAAAGEVTRVISTGWSRPIPFEVIVHRDVTVNEMLELVDEPPSPLEAE